MRRYIVFLNKSARKIQSAYRGHLGRLHFQVIVKAALEKMKNDFYNKMATRIQLESENLIYHIIWFNLKKFSKHEN